MINFDQLETRSRVLLAAESSVRWEAADIMGAANDAIDELSEATGFYERSVPIPLKGKRTYYDLRGYLPAGASRVNAIFNPTITDWLRPRGIRTFSNTPKWWTHDGSPTRFLMRGLFWLAIYPRPGADASPLTLYYSGMAPHYRDSSTVIPDLTDDVIPAVEEYILYDLLASDGEISKAMAHWMAFNARAKMLAKQVRERMASRTGALG